MIINAYICTDDENVISKNLIFAARFNGTLREPSSILKPSITFEYSGNPSTWTHIGIADFARIYFITDIISVGKNLWQISGRVDVLYTYRGNRADRDGLYGLTGIVVRNADETDSTLTDGAIPIQNNTLIDRINTTLFSGNPWVSSDRIYKRENAGDTTYKRYCQMSALTPLDANDAEITATLPQAFYCMFLADYIDCAQDIMQSSAVADNKSFADYIISNFWLPFEPEIDNTAAVKKLQRGAFQQDFTFGLPKSLVKPTNTTHIWYCSLSADNIYKYKNFAPYKDIFVQFQPFGRLKLDNSVIFSGVNHTAYLYLKTVTNQITGDSVLYYGTSETDCDIFLAQSNVKIDLPFTANLTNYGQIAAGLSTAIIAASAIADGGISATLGAVGGIVSGLSTAVNSTRNTSAGGLSGKFIDGAPLVLVYDNTTNAAARNNAILGQPLYESRRFDTIHGYAEITHVHFDSINATAAEKEELKALLAAGVIFDNETP